MRRLFLTKIGFMVMLFSTPLVTGCSAQQAGDTAFRTLENTARNICETAGNCQNTCPDQSPAMKPGYTCH